MPIHIDPLQLPKDKVLANKVVDNVGSINRIEAERGWLGSFWGAVSHIPHNIAASLIVVLAITGITYTFVRLNNPLDDKSLSVKDFWAIISPLITLSIGYLFGEKKEKE